ncbi:MAG: hypothetical protein KIT80_05825 [Chitinophagaceae bacterium]|nr:hypothetical protein [Chitinophagaceae bacterium]MCW5926411.1 hypothetical protein [Chitinophagaceae bacterium]
MKRTILISLSFFIFANVGFAQTPFSELSKVVDVLPPSPTAGALGEYGNTPVGTSTGTPQISIPLYTLKTQNLSVPFTLNYSTNGIRVDELSGNVGMGWVFNGTGVISRTVYGNPDESTTWLSTPGYLGTGETQQILDYLNEAANISATATGMKDNQPDIFSFNFNGYSGKFLYDSTRNIVQLLHSNLKIEQAMLGYKITTPDGVSYHFGGNGAIEKTKTFSSCSHGYATLTPTAYYLKKIVHPKGDSVIFNYNVKNYTYYTGISQTFTFSTNITGTNECGTVIPCQGIDFSTCVARLNIDAVTLREVITSQGDKVVFRNVLRNDIADSLVSRIDIYDRKDWVTPFKFFDLNYIYSNSGSAYTNAHTVPELKTRPFLLNISEKNAADLNRYYAFEYNDINGLPPRLSFAQDERGYFNGENNSHLIPLSNNYDYRQIFPTTMANRKPNAVYSSKGVLKKIHYPTKGYDSLVYEGHTIYGPVYTPNAPTPVSVSVIGVGNHSAGTNVTSNCILPVAQTINFTFSCAAVPGKSPNPNDNYGMVTVFKNGVSYLTETIALGQTLNITRELNTGTYKVEVKAFGESVSCSASFSYSAGGTTSSQNIPVGGIRISKIYSYTHNNQIATSKKYYYAASINTLNESTGMVVDPVGDYYEAITRIAVCEADNPPALNYKFCPFLIAYSGASRNIAGGSGSHIYYTTVLESFGENFENGGKEHVFFVTPNQASEMVRGFRVQGTVLTNIGFRNGMQSQENDFSVLGSQMVYKKKVTYSYTIDTRIYKEIKGYTVRKRHAPPIHYTPPDESEFSGFDVSQYWINIRWVPLSTITTTTYDANGNNPLVKVVENTYSNVQHALPTEVKTTTSEGKEEIVITAYPSDYANGTAFIENMKNNHLIGLPIEQVKYKVEGSSKKILAGSITQYQTGGKGVKSSEMILETASSIELTNFKFSNRATGVLPPSGTATSFNADSKYKIRLSYNSYDILNNLQQYTFSDNTPVAFIWDYKMQYPIAQVTNAAYSSIAYTSFEADGKGNWTYTGTPSNDATAPTGKKVFTIVSSSNNITKTGLSSSATYIVSYWKKSGSVSVNSTASITGSTINGWTYYEHKVVNPVGGTITVSGTNGVIDELRLYPETAQMTTHTYDPLIGMTSQCDVNNRITYYRYDGFGRLSLVLDQDKNVVKNICYNYAGQPESCLLYGNQLQTRSIKRNNCTGCQIGSYVTYTVAADSYFASSQPAANALAQNEIDTDGQTYANSNGTCTAPAMTNINGYNGVSGKNFTAVFHNNCTGTNYTIYLNAGVSGVNLNPQIPTGNYNVTITPSGGGGPYSYGLAGFYQYANTANMLGVDISTTQRYLVIQP